MKTTLQRIKEYIDYKGISVSSFEKSLGMSNGSFASQLKNNKTIGVDKLENILHEYSDLSPYWLLIGEGKMLLDHETHGYVADDPGAYTQTNKIPLLPASAVAGKGLGEFNDLQIDAYYHVPEFGAADFLISVKGNSMYPKYNSGDLLACKLLKDHLFFQWNKPHVIYTESQGVMVKRLKRGSTPDFIGCVSDNKDYDDFEVPMVDIVDLAIVIGVIRLE